jgi:hypothetical protein
MNNYSSTINNRLEAIVNNPIKNIGSNINNNVERFVNTPIKDISSKVSNGLYNNNYDPETGSDYMQGSNSNSSSFKKVFFWIVIILVLSFLGFNIFAYLAYGTDIFASIMAPFTYTIAYFTGETAKTTLTHTSQGTQAIVNESSNFLQIFLKFMTDLFNNTLVLVTTTSTSAINYLQSNMKSLESNIEKDKTTNVKPEKQIQEKQISEKSANANTKETSDDTYDTDDTDESTLLKEERKVEARVPNVSDNIKKLIIQKEKTEPEPVHSDTQQNGYCYIGKINNSRYCAKVSSKNSCMSGDIFPTMAVCINPNLKT